VKHVVLNSALGAGDYAKSFPGWHRKVEDNSSNKNQLHDTAANGFCRTSLPTMLPAFGARRVLRGHGRCKGQLSGRW